MASSTGSPVPKGGRAGARAPAADKSKQSGVQDFKARELEDEFKTKHFGVMGVLIWIL